MSKKKIPTFSEHPKNTDPYEVVWHCRVLPRNKVKSDLYKETENGAYEDGSGGRDDAGTWWSVRVFR